MQIFIDEYGLRSNQDVFIVSDDASFVQARQRILAYKLSGERQSAIAVTTFPYTKWFSDLESESSFTISMILPSLKLYEKFKDLKIDEELREVDIIDLGLIDLAVEPTETYIIDEFIGKFLLDDSSIITKLYYITQYVINPHEKFSNSSYLKAKWARYLGRLLNKSNVFTQILEVILRKAIDLDLDFCKAVNELIYVSNSKFILKERLYEHHNLLESTFKNSGSDLLELLSGIQSSFPINKLYEKRMEKDFRSLYESDIAEFLIETGSYQSSLTAFIKVADTVSLDQKEYIITKFSDIIDHELEARISRKIRPKLGPPPSMDSLSLKQQFKSWQKWALDEYIPFKYFLDENPSERDYPVIEEYATAYSDWLVNSYSSLIMDGDITSYSISKRINDELQDYRIVWLIIDGFPSVYVNTLHAILLANGINIVQPDYLLAAIPTITEIGIPTQLNGKFPRSETYTKAREDALNSTFDSRVIVFSNSVKRFPDVLESKYDLCCLHWREIDSFLHKNDDDIESNRVDEIGRLLNLRIKQIAEVIKSNPDDKLKIIISTDHGSTKCLIKGHSIKNSSLLEACKDNPKERCVEVTGKLSHVNLDLNEVYFLNKEETQNNEDWVVAKGYRYFGRFDYGYRHGGLTPEETIIPFLQCEIESTASQGLTVSLEGRVELQLGFTNNIAFTLKNENTLPVEVFEILVEDDKNFGIKSNILVEESSSTRFEALIKVPKSTHIENHIVSISMKIRYNMVGVVHEEKCDVNIPVKKSINEDLDNILI